MNAQSEYMARVFRDPESCFGWYIHSDYNDSEQFRDLDYALTKFGAKHKARKRLKQLKRLDYSWDNKEFKVTL